MPATSSPFIQLKTSKKDAPMKRQEKEVTGEISVRHMAHSYLHVEMARRSFASPERMAPKPQFLFEKGQRCVEILNIPLNSLLTHVQTQKLLVKRQREDEESHEDKDGDGEQLHRSADESCSSDDKELRKGPVRFLNLILIHTST